MKLHGKFFRYLIRLAIVLGGTVALGTIAIGLVGLRDDVAPADVGLVLGSKVETDGRPSKRLQARLDRAVELYRGGYFPLVMVSGGFGKEGYDEAAVMRDYLVGRGIPGSLILCDGHGDTTYASAQNARVILKEKKLKSVLVVTQYFHLPRARLALRRCGVETIYAAQARIYEWRDVYSAVRETLAYGYYLVRSYGGAQG